MGNKAVKESLVILIMGALLIAATARSHVKTVAVQPTPIAKHYGVGTIERVARLRGLYGTRADTTGYASTPDCARIGRVAQASFYYPREQRWGPVERLLVVDCSQAVDRARHVAEGLVLETDYSTAERGGWVWDGEEGDGRTLVHLLGFSN